MLFSIGNPTVSKSKQNHGIILIPLTFNTVRMAGVVLLILLRDIVQS